MHFILLTMLLFIKGGKFVYKMFILNVVSMYLSATQQFRLFQMSWTVISWGFYGLSYSGGLAQVGNKSQRWGEAQKYEETMWKKQINK